MRILPFDDSTPKAMQAAALQLACDELDGKDVVFHATGGTKLHGAGHPPATAAEPGRRQGSYRLLYADTAHQSLSWLDDEPRQEPMQDVLTLNEQLLLRGYRTSNDTRPAQIQQRASERAGVTRFMGEKSAQPRAFWARSTTPAPPPTARAWRANWITFPTQTALPATCWSWRRTRAC
ncbi:MAG: hypothetical protein R3E70_15130 [Burkholderiaceae bacterium]